MEIDYYVVALTDWRGSCEGYLSSALGVSPRMIRVSKNKEGGARFKSRESAMKAVDKIQGSMDKGIYKGKYKGYQLRIYPKHKG